MVQAVEDEVESERELHVAVAPTHDPVVADGHRKLGDARKAGRHRRADPEPAWWLDLQADPSASIELPEGRREVTARAAIGDERERLWAKWLALDSSAFTDA
jgi:hypothetical protein